MKQQCSYIDDYHIYIGQCGFHIMEFAEMAWRNGYTYLPEHPREQDCCDTYALYQIKDVIKTDYFCCAYERAKERIKPTDYRCVYRGNIGPGTTLEDLRKKHSVEHRPRGGTLRSLYDSDILLVNQGGKQTAYYVEDEKFLELPNGFAAQLSQQNKPEKNKHKHEFERYVYLLRRYKRPTRKRISYEMRREVLRLEPYQAQFLYLHEHGISTVEQLMERQAQIEQEIQQRTEHRQPLYAKRRYETDEKIKEVLAREIDQQTTALRELRKERKLCKQIANQVPGIQQNLREFEAKRTSKQKEVMKHEYQRRNR